MSDALIIIVFIFGLFYGLKHYHRKPRKLKEAKTVHWVVGITISLIILGLLTK